MVCEKIRDIIDELMQRKAVKSNINLYLINFFILICIASDKNLFHTPNIQNYCVIIKMVVEYCKRRGNIWQKKKQ